MAHHHRYRRRRTPRRAFWILGPRAAADFRLARDEYKWALSMFNVPSAYLLCQPSSKDAALISRPIR